METKTDRLEIIELAVTVMILMVCKNIPKSRNLAVALRLLARFAEDDVPLNPMQLDQELDFIIAEMERES